LYKDAVGDPGNGIAPVSSTWAKKHVLGFSDEEMDDITSSDDTFFKDVFGDEDDDFELSAGYTKARDLITKLRQQYRNMSDEDLDEFSKEMITHFLDNIAAKEKAKTILTKKGIV